MAVDNKPFHASYIDGLRALAVLSVIVYHLNDSWLPGGFAGVDVFFVISGFVVAMSVSELKDVRLPGFLAYFYARRLIRITPALIICLLATFVASAIFIPEAWLSASNQKAGLFAFFGLSNFILSSNAGNYFSPLAEFNPFTHTWSLAVEEQFYLIFPLMFFIWLKGRKKISMVVFAVALLASLGCAAALGQKDQIQAFYMIWSRFWELAVGVILFQALDFCGHSFDEPSPHLRWSSLLGTLGLFLIVTGLIVARPQLAPFPACLLPVAGTALVLGSLHGRQGSFPGGLLTFKPIVFIGKISYSLYLWHWPIFVLFRWTVGLESHYWQLTAILLTIIFSIFSYYVVEQPPRRWANGVKKIVLIAFGLFVMGASYFVASVIASHQSSLSLSVVSKNKDLWYPEGPALIASDNGCHSSTQNISFAGGDVLKHFREGCADLQNDPRNIFVLGDSHAMHYNSMLRKLVADSGITVYQYTVGGCPFVSLQPHRENEGCKQFGTSAVADMLDRIRVGDIVFLPSLRLPRLVDQSEVFGVDFARQSIQSEDSARGRAQSIKQAVPILNDIQSRGAIIIFEAPTPMLESVPFRCSDWFNRNNPICTRGMSISRSLMEELRAPTIEAYAKIASEVPHVKVWDPLPLLCFENDCSAFRDGNPLFFDGDHLTYYSNMLLLQSFRASIDAAVR